MLVSIPTPNRIVSSPSLNRKSRLDQIEAAFKALGKRLDIAIRDAA